jgi:putative transposase
MFIAGMLLPGMCYSLDADNSLYVLKMAIGYYDKPEIVNSDQGSQFACVLWTE